MKNLRPFNQEEFDAGHPAVTRDGRKILEAVSFKSDTEYPVRVIIEDGNVISCQRDGKYNKNDWSGESDNDIFMAPKMKTLWFCAYKLMNRHYATGMYASEKEMEKDVTQVDGVIVKSQFIEVEVEE